MPTLRFLLLEDNPLDAEVVQVTLTDGGIDCELLRVDNRADFVRALETSEFDLILADYTLPGFDGISALKMACNLRPDIPFIFVSACLGEELAIETLKRGATDYVLKQRLGRLVPCVHRALRSAQERRERKRAELMLVEQKRLLELIASGRPLEECLCAVCASVSKLNPRIRACIHLTDAQQLTFNRSITPDFPPSLGQELKDAPINDLCIGTCGEAVYCGQPVICADIANDDRWSQEWRDLCVAHGILACHSTPVLGLNGLPLGSLMLCFDEARLPTDWEYQLAEFGTHVASIAFEREQSNLALRQNEARLRAVAANLPNGAVFIVDRDLRYLLAEGKALEGAGMTSVDLVGKTLWEVLDPTLVASYFTYYRQALGGEPFSLEHCSHDRYYISHGTPLYNDRGEIDAVLAVSYDITDRKRAELNAEFLANVSQDLVGATSVDEIVQTVGEQLNRYLNTSMCAFVEINEGARQAVINHNWHQNDVPSLVGVYSILEFVTDEFLQAAKAGQTIVVRDVTIDPRIAEAQRYATLKIGAEINVPLIRDGKWKFSLTVFHQAPYDWREDEIELMRELANRIWAKVERARTEAALRESEEQSRNILESINDAFFALDENWLFTYVNQTAKTLLDRTPGDLIGKNFWSEFPGLNGSEFELLHRRVAKERVADSLTAFYPDHNRWYEVRSYPATNGITIYFRNVTDRIQAEAALRESEAALRQSEARFRLIVESAKEYAIFTLDLNGVVTSWSSGAERLLGYQEAEIIGCNSRIIYTPEDNERGRAERERQTVLTQGQAENECWHMRKDGSRFWGSGLVMPLQNEAGNMQGFIKIMQDKTKARQADERFRLLYDTTCDLLATEQPLTLMHNLFSKLSAQLELDYYYNYMVEEKDNQPMLHLRNYEGISDEAAQSIEWIELGQYLCGRVAQERRQIVLDRAQISTHPNAQQICSIGITAYAGQPLIVQGRLLGTLSFASRTRTGFTPEEIDLLQSTCDQIAIALERANLIASIQQQAEQLQQANRIKDEFLAVLSHELRSPLNPILGWTQLLRTGKLDTARQAEALGTIERNAKLQAQLIEDLLDISRIMQGKLSLTAVPVSLTFVISAAVETVRLAAEAKNIQLQLDLDPAIAPISGDAARLQQVVWNLLTNAVKFTPNGGQVTVELRQVDCLAQIRVMDTGKGINPNFLPYVFEYFRQEDGSTTRKFGGLGLGLAIVRQIVEMHGGTVRAQSRGENQGATFIVQLPAMQQTTPIGSEPKST